MNNKDLFRVLKAQHVFDVADRQMGEHAFIWHLDDKGVVRFYEPQTGKRWAPKLLAVNLVE